MRILLLAPHPFLQARGTPLAVKAMLEFLSARGHVVDLLTYHEGDDVLIHNCSIHRIPRLPGIRNIRPGFSFKKVACDILMFGKCLQMVLRQRYDLIHAVEEAAFIAAVMRSIAGVPYVYDMDSSMADQLVEAYPRLSFALGTLRRCEAIAVRRSLGVLTICAALEDLALGLSPHQTVGRVEDTTLLSGSPEPPGGDGLLDDDVLAGPVAMYVGNLAKYQGIDLLLEGFRHTLRAVANARLVIIGGPDETIAHYRARAAALDIQPAVHFLGPRPVESLAGLLQEADVLVSPRLKGLNTPMKIYSYLDSGTAVLATRLRTHTQVLHDGVALLVEPDPEALGKGLADLLSDPARRERLASQAKELVRREFTPEAARRKLDLFYTMMETRVAESKR